MTQEQPVVPLQAPTDERHAPAVECLGITFPSEDERRSYFLDRLKEKLPELRERDDFPIGEDDDILRLSDPPYYTACPNPFLAEFVSHHGRPYDPEEPYHREPFAVDVSEGKNDPLYKAHGYHTKVPHRAIVPSILHYTKPGDIVLDGFCGSGMTGVAAQWCGTAPPGYRLKLEQQWREEGREPPEWGARRAILGDLSPAATFIAANYNIPFDVAAFSDAASQLLREVNDEIGWMYETLHTDGKTKGRISYTVWSEVFACPECAGEVVFLQEALDIETGKTRESFPCPHCAADLTKRKLQRSFETLVDPASGEPWQRIGLKPVRVRYIVGESVHEKDPDEHDLDLLDRVERLPMSAEMPTSEFPIEQMYHGSRLEPKGFSNVHHLYLARARHALGAVWRMANAERMRPLRNALLFFVEESVWNLSVLNRYRPTGFSQNTQWLKGVYYAPSQMSECSPWYVLENRLKRLAKLPPSGGTAHHPGTLVSTGNCGRLKATANSVDYIFTDPPFGENIYYADLNFLVESWHRVRTSPGEEAIIDQKKHKDLAEYRKLMQHCFEEYCRVLKPGRWMTIVFHNSKSAVWNAIQEAMLAAGFVVADVRTLDKQQGSYRQVTSTAVKQDLVISAYKPNGGLEGRFRLVAGTEDGVWDFIRTHMRQLPVFVTKDGRVEVVAERQAYMLFDRMVAFHVQRGVTVPLSLAEFQRGLIQRFPERDSTYFLPEQVVDYDRKRIKAGEIVQLELFVKDEESAIQWLRQQLRARPRSFQDIHPDFIPELAGWQKHEQMLELSELLAQNFLRYDGNGPVPNQIHAYLSTNFKDLRGLRNEHQTLQAKAKDRWYVPDPNKAADLHALRERSLLRDFDQYAASTSRRLRQFRLEALRAGFRRAWQNRDYETIVTVAKKVPDSVLQEDPKLLMWHDQASTRVEKG